MTKPDAGQTPIEMRINDYLSCGGLFNPECANHDAVRDLILDCRAAFAAAHAELAAAKEAQERAETSANKWYVQTMQQSSEAEIRTEKVEAENAELRKDAERAGRTITTPDQTVSLTRESIEEFRQKFIAWIPKRVAEMAQTGEWENNPGKAIRGANILCDMAIRAKKAEAENADLHARLLLHDSPCACVPDGDDGSVRILCKWHEKEFARRTTASKVPK